MGVEKVLITKQGRIFYVRDSSKDLHTQYGFIKAVDIKKAKPGSTLATNTGKELFVLNQSFVDVYKKIKRSAQIIPLKDVGTIVAETGINSKTRVVDAGAGSGGLACFLANIAKDVVTYDVRDDFIKIVKRNKEYLGLKWPGTDKYIREYLSPGQDIFNLTHDAVMHALAIKYEMLRVLPDKCYAAHFGLVPSAYYDIIDGEYKINTVMGDMDGPIADIECVVYSKPKDEWLSAMLGILHQGDYDHILDTRLKPRGFVYSEDVI